MLRLLYNILLWIIFPFISLWLFKKDLKTKTSFLQRCGFNYPILDRSKPLIWLHAVSMGEVRAATEVIKLLQLQYPHYNILVTNMTATGQEISKKTLGNVTVCLVPLDYPFMVKRFFRYFRPQIGIILETEVWPNLLHYANKNQVKLVLANARMSDKSCNGYLRFADFSRDIFNKFDVILAQDSNSSDNFKHLGFSGAIEIVGNTKFDLAMPNNIGDLSQLTDARKIITFASSRDGEEEMIVQYLSKLDKYLLLIVPRHDYRFVEIKNILTKYNIKYQLRSDKVALRHDTQVLLGDSMGELFAYYQISDIVIMGGSFADYGCQNPLEPLMLDLPVIIGPSTYNFRKICRDLFEQGVAIEVNNMEQALSKANELLANQDKYINYQNKVQSFLDKYKGASQKVVSSIGQLIK